MLKGIHLVIGPPGCGKTTNLAALVKNEVAENNSAFGRLHPNPVMVCSLTRAAAAEAAGRDMPIKREAIGTLHSHAYRAIGRPVVAESKIGDFVAKHPMYPMADVKPDTDDPSWEVSREASKNEGDKLMAEYMLCRHNLTPRDAWKRSVQLFADRWEKWKDQDGMIDFADMIERACDVAPDPMPRVMFIDEAQDFSLLELKLLRTWYTKGCEAMVITGDPWQALYEWRGAFPQMFASDKVPADHRSTLSQSYRVPKAVHRLAMTWAKRLSTFVPIQYEPRDDDGEVITTPATFQNPRALLSLIESETKAGRSIMLQATCGYQIQPTVNMLRAGGIPFSNPWRRKRGDWNPLHGRGVTTADRLLALLKAPIEDRLWTCSEVNDWASEMEAAGTLKRGAKTAMEALAIATPGEQVTFDQMLELFDVDALTELWGVAWDDPKGLIRWWCERLLDRRRKLVGYPIEVFRRGGLVALTAEPRVFVGTVHSFKGAEADTVVLFPDLSPQGASELASNPDPVTRLGYVAITRARQRFVLARAVSTSLSMPIVRCFDHR